MELSELRKQIDEIDDQIARLLNARCGCVSMIGAYKKAHHLDTLDPKREEEKLRFLGNKYGNPFMSSVFQCIMDCSKAQQNALAKLRFGLLGRKLGHSYSPEIHALLAPYRYDLIEAEPEDLESVFKNDEYCGLNVTIPYKKTVAAYCSILTDHAARAGCVNTVWRKNEGTLVGDNTDVFGFSHMIQTSGIDVTGKKVLIFGGSGGAGAAVRCALEDHGAGAIVTISRSGEDNYGNLSKHAVAQILVNATPLGMWPDVDSSPCDIAAFPAVEGVFDVVYNPLRTAFLMQAEQLGVPCMGGLSMLTAQACMSSIDFSGGSYTLHEDIPDLICREIQLQKENIVLIGMPGCGKTTIGKRLAMELNRPFFDADEEFEKVTGFTPENYLRKNSESAFREIESKILKALGCRSGCVIATGGGCVKHECNYASLHCNGRIVWLQRDLDDLPTDGRPLSQQTDLHALYEQREPLYRRFADMEISNRGAENDVVASILEALS